jgi:CRISPR-associated protein Cas2
LFEPQTGVFVGTVSALVRDQLWKKCEKRLRGGAMMQLWATNTEQGFAMRTSGALSKEVVDYQGLQLLRTPLPAKKDRPE